MWFPILPHRGHLPLHVSLPWAPGPQHCNSRAVLGTSENEDSPPSTLRFTPFPRDAPRPSRFRNGLKTIPVAASLSAEPTLYGFVKAEGSLINYSRVGASFL